MKPSAFAYHAPRSVPDAVALLAELAPEGGRVLAGGQSLVPMMAFRLAQPPHLVDINRLPDLNRVSVKDGVLRIPALVRHAAVSAGLAPGPLGPLLSTVSRHIAHLPIRSRGTVCGSLANADPASEWLTVFAALDGTAWARGPDGARAIPAAGFVPSIMTTALHPAELLEAIGLPLLRDGTRWGFHEHSRRAGDYALAMTLVTYRVEHGRIVAPRVAAGGVETRPRRLPQAEEALLGATPDAATFARAAAAAAAEITPMEDAQAHAAFRRDLLRATTSRALMASL